VTPHERGPRTVHSTLSVAMLAVAVVVFALIAVLLLTRQAPRSAPPIAKAPSTPGVLATPTPLTLPGAQHADVSAPSTNVVWVLVADRYLYRSIDRGETWVQSPLPPSRDPFSLPEISFVNDHEGWLKTGSVPVTFAYCSAERIAVWHTTNAGATWQMVVKQGSLDAAPATTPPSSGIQDPRCKVRLSFADSNRGFLGTWDSTRVPVIYSTKDGGQTWKVSDTLPDPPGFREAGGSTFQLESVRAFGSTLLASAYDGLGVEYVFKSTDGGVTWIYSSASSLPHMTFVTASTWLHLFPGNGQSAETTDGGATWRVIPSDYPGSDYPGPVFADSSVGYANVGAGILRTVDGGRHWVTVDTPWTTAKPTS
jgi:photosystem II stability/assembly factor-like uncharacterized protein